MHRLIVTFKFIIITTIFHSVYFFSHRSRHNTAPELVHIDDGCRGQHVSGANIPATVSLRRHRLRRRRRQRLRPVRVAIGDERPHPVAGRHRVRHRHVRQPKRGVGSVSRVRRCRRRHDNSRSHRRRRLQFNRAGGKLSIVITRRYSNSYNRYVRVVSNRFGKKKKKN